MHECMNLNLNLTLHLPLIRFPRFFRNSSTTFFLFFFPCVEFCRGLSRFSALTDVFSFCCCCDPNAFRKDLWFPLLFQLFTTLPPWGQGRSFLDNRAMCLRGFQDFKVPRAAVVGSGGLGVSKGFCCEDCYRITERAWDGDFLCSALNRSISWVWLRRSIRDSDAVLYSLKTLRSFCKYRLGRRGVKKPRMSKLSKIMEGPVDGDDEASSDERLFDPHGLSDEIDIQRARFPCCVVWTPLPVVSWLAPFIGHVGICREDGVILDFAGPMFISVDDFAFGAVARFIKLSKNECCFPPHLSGHTCKHGFRHSELGTSITWDDALQSCTQHFQHKSYNLFTCNCHSYVASCLNRFAYGGSIDWNVVSVAFLILFRGQWVNKMAIVRSFSPFFLVTCIGLLVAGWPFLVGLSLFSLLLITWFVLGTYFKSLVEC